MIGSYGVQLFDIIEYFCQGYVCFYMYIYSIGVLIFDYVVAAVKVIDNIVYVVIWSEYIYFYDGFK